MLNRILQSVVATAVLLLSSASYAQQTPGKFRLSGFVSNPGYSQSDFGGSDFSGGLGVGAEYFFTPKVSTSLQVSSESYTSGTFFSYDPANGVAVYDVIRERTYPVDAFARYHFSGSDRWKPYVGAGLRANGTRRLSNYLGDIQEFRDWTVGLQVDGGVTYQISPSLGLEFELKHALQDESSPIDRTRGSIGMSWRF